jgi:CheY-like chemotaxis protein
LSFEQRKYVEVIHRSGKSLLALLGDILDLAALESGRLELETTPVDARALIRDVAERGREITRRKGLPLRANVPRAPIMVRADDDRLRQVLLNLIDHAVAQTSNGYVEVQADAQDQAVNFRVTDTGPGIPGELPRTRLEDFLDAPGGAATTASNLGLLLAERLVKLMGGDLSIENVSGEGTTFLISLPAAPMEETGAGLPAPEEEPVPLARAGGQVLLVDDDDVERAHVTTLLERAGYDVSAAKSGDEGLGRLRQQPFDAVVLDLVMPGMSGLDVLRAARLDERLARLPFVVLSALYMTKSEREVLGPSVAGVVRKGERIGEELLALLRHAVETSEPTRPARAPAPAAPTARVLVVEDDDDNLFTIKQVLASLPVQLETATTAREAIAICASRRPDLVVMDVELPDVSGLDAARDIRRLPSCGEIPIIALTARATPADREEVLAAHFADYLPKPLQPREVVGAVSRALHLGASDRLAPHPPGASPTR